MDKPTPKKEVVVFYHSEISKMIVIYSTADAITEFAEFGHIATFPNSSQYTLFVDARYDFLEVLSYIENYG